MKPDMKAVAERIRAAGGYRWVGIYEVGADEIFALAWTGSTAPDFPRFPRNRGLCGAAATSGETVIVGDVRRDSRYLTTFGSTRSEMIVPVKDASGAVVGLIDVESEKVDAFGDEDRRRVEGNASELARSWSKTG